MLPWMMLCFFIVDYCFGVLDATVNSLDDIVNTWVIDVVDTLIDFECCLMHRA